LQCLLLISFYVEIFILI